MLPSNGLLSRRGVLKGAAGAALSLAVPAISAHVTQLVAADDISLRQLADQIDFKIGTGIGGFGFADDYKTLVAIQKREFNMGMVFVMWHSSERERGKLDYGPSLSDVNNIAVPAGMDTLGHALVWGSRPPPPGCPVPASLGMTLSAS